MKLNSDTASVILNMHVHFTQIFWKVLFLFLYFFVLFIIDSFNKSW